MLVHQFFKNGGKGGDLFGVELEMEGHILPKGLVCGDIWRVEEDGSLRGQDNAEYVLRRPLELHATKEAFSFLVEEIEERGEDPSPSNRTSTHLHVDCRTLTLNQLMNFVVLLVIFEELLVDWCGEGRKGNLFCLQSKDAEVFYTAISRFLETGMRHSFSDEIRYSAINLASLNKYGSVEIRSLQGTLDVEVFNTWIGVIAHLRKLAEAYDTPWSILKEMSFSGPEGFARKVLGPYFKTFYKGAGRSRKLREAMRRGQDIAYSASLPKAQKWMTMELNVPKQKGRDKLEGNPFLIPLGGLEAKVVPAAVAWLDDEEEDDDEE